MNGGATLIKFDQISKKYGNSHTYAVQELSLEVKEGEVFGFLGPNGAGKTTSIKMACGMIKPDRGDITINGVSILKDPLQAKKMIGYVPDGPEPFDRLTGKEYVHFMADVYEVPATVREQRIPQLLEKYEMNTPWNDRISSYSRGMKQKISLIGALVNEPKLWLLDEPMVGLDPKSAHLLKEDMREHCQKGNSVFFSTHVLEVAEKLCDRIGIIHQGRCIAVGTIDELHQLKGETEIKGRSLEELFLEMTSL
jgi:ABC-2 type transport system ATP-binding protein